MTRKWRDWTRNETWLKERTNRSEEGDADTGEREREQAESDCRRRGDEGDCALTASKTAQDGALTANWFNRTKCRAADQ